jgi:predicted GIY-YIG superfamily endonuclease
VNRAEQWRWRDVRLTLNGASLRELHGKPVLYRLYDKDGALLYVGVTLHAAERFIHHRCPSTRWSAAVARVEVQLFGNQESALHGEAWAIATEKPKFNAKMSLTDRIVAPKGWDRIKK